MPPQTRVPSVSHVRFNPLDALPQPQPIAAAQAHLRRGRPAAEVPAAAGVRRSFGNARPGREAARPRPENGRADTARPVFGIDRQVREEMLSMQREQNDLIRLQNDLLVRQNELLETITEQLASPLGIVAASSEDGAEARVEAGAQHVGADPSQPDVVSEAAPE